MKDPAPNSHGRTLRLFIVLSFIAFLTTLGVGYYSFVHLPQQIARSAADSIEQGFNQTKAIAEAFIDRAATRLGLSTQVETAERTYFKKSTALSELATRRQKITEVYKYKTTWLRSEKSITMKADFTVKAGYDLKDILKVEILPDGSLQTKTLPQAKILSVEMSNLRTVKDQGGLWNRISAADRDRATNHLKAAARKTASQSGILQDAERNIEEEIQKIYEQTLAEVGKRTPSSINQ